MDVFGGRGRSAATASMPPPGGGGKVPLAAGAAGVTCAMAMTFVTVYASATVMPSRRRRVSTQQMSPEQPTKTKSAAIMPTIHQTSTSSSSSQVSRFFAQQLLQLTPYVTSETTHVWQLLTSLMHVSPVDTFRDVSS